MCKTHGLFSQSYANHNVGKGCPTCAKEFNPRFKSGFIKSYNNKNYASLYLIRCFNETESFYKIGITTKPLSRRFAGSKALPYSYEEIYVHTGTAEEVWDLEILLHRKYKNFKYIPMLHFGGMFECFSEIAFDSYKEMLKAV